MPFSNSQEMGRPLKIKDEGVTVVNNASSIDLTGDGVTASAVGSEVTEDIPGGGSGFFARAATFIVAASDADDTTNADYICDGVNDEVQINQAIADLPAGGRIILSEGTFNLSQTELSYAIRINKSNVTLEGQGNSTTLKLVDGEDNTNVIEIGDISGSDSNIVVRNLKIDGNMATLDTNFAAGILVNNTITGGVVVENCHIVNTVASNIYIDEAAGVTIKNNVLDSTKATVGFANIEGGGDNLLVEGNLCVAGDSANISVSTFGKVGLIISKNICQNSGGYGIYNHGSWDAVISDNFVLNPTSTAISNTFPSQITGNTIEIRNDPTGPCIQCTGSDSTIIQGNHILVLDGNAAAVTGISIGAAYHLVDGNLIHFETTNDDQNLAHVGIYIDSSQVSITGNLIVQDDPNTGSIGIVGNGWSEINISGNNINQFDVGIDASFFIDCSISGNLLYGNNLGIDISRASDITISGNSFESSINFIASTSDSITKKVNINGNAFFDSTQDSIILRSCQYCIVANNTFRTFGRATNNTYSAIILQTVSGTNYSIYNVITGNNMTSTHGNAPKYGIREDSANDGPNIVTSNVALNAVTAQISTQHGSTVSANNLTT